MKPRKLTITFTDGTVHSDFYDDIGHTDGVLWALKRHCDDTVRWPLVNIKSWEVERR